MKGHFSFVFILKRVFDRCPEIHCHSPDLDLCLNPPGTIDSFHCIINDQMIASVSALLNVLQIILFAFYCHIAAFLDHSRDSVNVFFKLADDPDPRNIFHFFLHTLYGDLLPLHLLKDAGHTFYSSPHLFNRRIEIVLFMLLDNMLELHRQLPYSKLIWT